MTYRLSDDEFMIAVRYERDKKLAETDWWALSDRTMTPEQTAYRQALRDFTDTVVRPDEQLMPCLENLNWPVKP
jgi:hypothetical protein